MKHPVKSFFLTLLIAAVVIPVVAQPQRGQRGGDRQQTQEFRNLPPEARSDAHLTVFDEYLNLTESQEEQLKAVDAEFAERGEALRDESMSRQRKMLARKDLRDAHQQAVHDILTKEQYSIFLEQREAIQHDIRQRLKAYSEDGNK